MTKIRIYQNQAFSIDDVVVLNKRNKHYLQKVLRVGMGANIIIFNGDGFDYLSTLDENFDAIILEQSKNKTESDLDITLITAISKGDKMDFVIQKATELGVKKITPIITQRTIYKSSKKDEKKRERWQEIAVNGCEQCGRSFVPKVENITTLGKLRLQGESFMLDTTSTKTLKEFNKPQTTINLIIGPEGGWSVEELENNYHKLSLGKRILRTETASIVALASVFAVWE